MSFQLEIHLSFLIDYYMLVSKDIIREILSENNIEFFNFICWTHPHADHSKGLFDFLDEFDSEKTTFLYPEYLMGQEWNNRTQDSKKILDIFSLLILGFIGILILSLYALKSFPILSLSIALVAFCLLLYFFVLYFIFFLIT